MATVWGEAEVILHTDGRSLPGEVRAATTEAAAVGGRAFQRRLRPEMRRAARVAVGDFARDFGSALARALRSLPAFNALSRRVQLLRRDFRTLGWAARNGLGLAFDNLRDRVNGVMEPMRQFRFEVGVQSARAVAELREGMEHLGISMDDVRDTFPGVTAGLANVRDGFNRTITSVREFATEVRERGRLASDEFREGLSRLKITADDVRDTFPGLTRVVEGTRTTFVRFGDRVREAGVRMRELFPITQTLATLKEDLGRATERLAGRFAKMRETMEDTRTGANDLRAAMENLRIDTMNANDAFDASIGVQANFGNALRKSERDSASFFGRWKRLPHGFRQFLVWTTVIVSAMEQLAVLSSAAGGGLLTLLGAATQFGIGVGATIAVFQDLTGELDELPEHLRPAAEAFQNIGDAFSRMQDFIQTTALRDAAAAFQSIADTVDALIPAFEPLAKVIGDAIGDFADAIKPGTDAFADLEKLIRDSADTFDTVLRTAGKFGDALLDAFTNPTMVRAIEGLVGWIDDLVESFAEFVNSDGFVEWIENSMDVLSEFGGLLEGIGTVLNNLVDEEAVERTVSMLDALTTSLPMFEALLSTLGELDVFGLIAEALAALTPLFEPLLQVLEPVAAIVRDVLIVAFNNLAIAFGIVSAILLPARLLWEALAAVFDAFVEWIAPVQEALIEVGGAVQDATDKIVEAFIPAFEEIADAIIEMLPSPEEFERFLREELIPMIDRFADWIINYAVPALMEFADWIRDEAVPAAREMWAFIRDHLIPFIEKIAGALGAANTAFHIFGSVVRGVLSTLFYPIQQAISWFNSLFAAANAAAGASKGAGKAGGGGGGGGGGGMASGGILNGPRRILAGEAGPEAIVPLNRSLSQVDESVRWLSAIAQGKTPAMASGGVVGGGKQVTIEAGAVQVHGSLNPQRDSLIILNRLAERIAG